MFWRWGEKWQLNRNLILNTVCVNAKWTLLFKNAKFFFNFCNYFFLGEHMKEKYLVSYAKKSDEKEKYNLKFSKYYSFM